MRKKFVRSTIYVNFLFSIATVDASAKQFYSLPLKNIENQFDMIDKNAIDYSINPGTDFYQYACGNWIKNTKLPADKTRYVRSFETIGDQNKQDIKLILESYANGKYDAGVTYAKELGSFYSSCMDETKIEQISTRLVQELITQISDKLKSKSNLPGIIARLHLLGVGAFFSFDANTDVLNPSVYLAELGQGGMGLTSPTYYTKTDERSLAVQKKYKDYITELLILSGDDAITAKGEAESVYAIESLLAQNSLAAEDMRDPTKLYHPINLTFLNSFAQNFNWTDYFISLKISAPEKFNNSEPKFLQTFNSILTDFTLEQIKSYLKFRLLQMTAPYLNKEFVNASFEFESRTLNGQKTDLPRWKKCTNVIEENMGNALGNAYVKKKFTPEAKQIALKLVGNIIKAYKEDLEKLDWLDETTRNAALEKLSLINVKIGYPDKWDSYDTLTIDKDFFLYNVLTSHIFIKTRDISKIGKQTDRNKWNMTPQTVNANYSPSTNSIEFPAAILQPPFFSEKANDAQNYGGIGLVIGHEITHGFDDSGSKFDGTGLMKDWWTKEAQEKFKIKSQCLNDQYSKFEVLPGLFVNGTLTLGENIADSGGVKLAYKAFELAKAESPKQQNYIQQEFSNEQQFYLSLGQVWCSISSDENTRRRIVEDPHSPPRFRVNGMLINDLNFGSAFNCTDGSCPMTPASRCEIW